MFFFTARKENSIRTSLWLRAFAALLLVFVALTFALAPAFAATGLENFEKKNKYTDAKFGDVSADHWAYENIRYCYELGLMNGISDTEFNPGGHIKISEALVVAARIHHIYYGGDGNVTGVASPWYLNAVNYCKQENIIKSSDFNGLYDHTITRAQLAYVFSNALPASQLIPKSESNPPEIPDVPKTDRYASNIYLLYSAGILTGMDEQGTFNGSFYITRGQAAAVISRLVEPELRLSATTP